MAWLDRVDNTCETDLNTHKTEQEVAGTKTGGRQTTVKYIDK